MAGTERPPRPVTATFRVIVDGFAGDLEATGSLEELIGLTAKMKMLGIEPANSPLLWQGQNGNGASQTTAAPTCPVHGSPMKPSTKGGGWFCPRKIDDGSYCKEKAA